MTEGVVYTIPSEQVEEYLAELDFREKGGCVRDVVNVVIYQNIYPSRHYGIEELQTIWHFGLDHFWTCPLQLPQWWFQLVQVGKIVTFCFNFTNSCKTQQCHIF